MLKKFLIIIFIMFIYIINSCYAYADTKITRVSFDYSDKIIFIATQNQNPTNEIPQRIKTIQLEDPKRIYFDLNDTILTMPNSSWTIKHSILDEVKVAQTSTNPNIVRVVITSNKDLSKMVVMQVPSGIVIRYDTDIAVNDFLSEIYRDVTFENSDYYEKVSITDSKTIQNTSSNINKVNENFEKINSAFSKDTSEKETSEKNIIPIPAQNLTVSDNISRIKTKYYLNRIDIKKENILISGIGSASIEKVKKLSDPNRIVYDIPNAVLNPKLRNNEYKINETESVRLGQFEQSKVRIVISTNDTSKYKPIFSQDMQGILFAHSDKMSNIKLYDKTTKITSYTVKHTNNYDLLTLNLSEPIIQSIVRDYNELNLTIYNADPLITPLFTEDIKSTAFKDIKITGITTNNFNAGVNITIPIDKYDTIYAYETQNAKQLILKIEPQKIIEKKHKAAEKINKNLGKNNIIILDAGHGGADVGATRNNVFEKDLNLIVTQKVYQILTEQGYKVEMTRTDDSNPTLQERCDFSNERNSAIFVSIHTNASVNEAPKGIETHFYNENSIKLSTIVHKHLISETKAIDRGTIKSMFYVINHTNVPAILVEIGYLSNEEERIELQTEERQNNTAKAIAKGIIEYLKGHK